MIIDFHCHIDFERAGGDDSASPEEVEEHLAENKVRIALLQPYSIKGDDIEHHLDVNRKVAEYAQDNGHYALVRVDPFRFTDSEIERLVKTGMFDLGALGIKLHPSDGYHISDLQDHTYVFELAQQFSLPIMIHTWTRNELDWLGPEKFSEVAELAGIYRDIKFIAAHVDVGKVEFDRHMNDNSNLYVDVSLQYFAPFRDYALADPSNPLLDRIFYGSDFGVGKFPINEDKNMHLSDGVVVPETVVSELPKEVAHKLLYQNAFDFFIRRI